MSLNCRMTLCTVSRWPQPCEVVLEWSFWPVLTSELSAVSWRAPAACPAPAPASNALYDNNTLRSALSQSECTRHKYQPTKHKTNTNTNIFHRIVSQKSTLALALCSSPLTHIRPLYYCVINGIITNLRHRARRPFAAEKILIKYFSKAHRRAADLSKMYKIR